MSTELLESAFASTRGLLATVTPEQLDLPTPCASWKLRDLIDHLVGISYWSAQAMEAGEATMRVETDSSGGDFVAAYDESIRAALGAFGAPGALERTVKLPFGEFPGAALIGLTTTDAFVHGWDVAKATGQSTDLNPELAATLLERARAAIPESFRGPDGAAPFGPIVEAPASASTADQLAAFLGRTP